MLSLSVGHQSGIVESRNRMRSDFKRVVAKLLQGSFSADITNRDNSKGSLLEIYQVGN